MGLSLSRSLRQLDAERVCTLHNCNLCGQISTTISLTTGRVLHFKAHQANLLTTCERRAEIKRKLHPRSSMPVSIHEMGHDLKQPATWKTQEAHAQHLSHRPYPNGAGHHEGRAMEFAMQRQQNHKASWK